MKKVIAGISFFCLIMAMFAGCEPAKKGDKSISTVSGDKQDQTSVTDMSGYAPTQIKIMPLTKFAEGGATENSKIKVYVSLLDSFGSQVKYPGKFRFELYEKVIRSPKPKGNRIMLWPDIDLLDAAENNKYWQDFLRSYQFNLDFGGKRGDYILQATFFSTDGKRLANEFDTAIK